MSHLRRHAMLEWFLDLQGCKYFEGELSIKKFKD